MPLEQLLAQYGYVMGAAAGTADADDAPGPSHRQNKHKEASEQGANSTDRPAKRRKTSEANALSSRGSGKQLHAAAQAMAAHASSAQLPGDSESESDDDSADLRDLLEDADIDTAPAAPSAGKVSGKSPKPESGKSPKPKPPDADADGDMDELDSSHSESEDFDSAAGSDAGEDDEQTLEEEERLANAEGAAQSVGVHAPCYTVLVRCTLGPPCHTLGALCCTALVCCTLGAPCCSLGPHKPLRYCPCSATKLY